MKNIVILLMLFVSLSFHAVAQEEGESYASMQYSMGLGTGATYSGISKYSFRGFSLDYKKFVSDNIAVGFDAQWNVLYQKKDYDTYTYKTASLSGMQNRSLNVFPFIVTADYFFFPASLIRPYVGLGIGAVHTIENIEMGVYAYNNKEWHFALKPQVGLWFPINNATKLSLSAEYLQCVKTADTDARQLFTFNIGFAFTPNE